MYRMLKGAVPPHKMPSKVHLLENFPENSHGKINRDVLMLKVKHCEEGFPKLEFKARTLLKDFV